MGVYQAIIDLLEAAGVEYRTMEHEPVRTSEQAAAVRGTDLARGAKALVLEHREGLVLAVISAASKVDFKALKTMLGDRGVQMASAEKVIRATGCQPGGVPPFGNLFGLRVIVDPTLLASEWIDFNAGERTRSVEMRTSDFVKLSGATVVDFAKR